MPDGKAAFFINGNFPGKEVLFYIMGQLGGALVASLVLKLLFPDSVTLGASLPAGTAMQSFILEFILTFLLML